MLRRTFLKAAAMVPIACSLPSFTEADVRPTGDLYLYGRMRVPALGVREIAIEYVQLMDDFMSRLLRFYLNDDWEQNEVHIGGDRLVTPDSFFVEQQQPVENRTRYYQPYTSGWVQIGGSIWQRQLGGYHTATFFLYGRLQNTPGMWRVDRNNLMRMFNRHEHELGVRP